MQVYGVSKNYSALLRILLTKEYSLLTNVQFSRVLSVGNTNKDIHSCFAFEGLLI